MEFTGGKIIPVIDISALIPGSANQDGLSATIKNIEDATQRVGFFYIANHGVSVELQAKLEILSRQFFSLPIEEKRKIDMSKGGKAWRGYFGVGDELTSGIPDQKEGIYLGSEDAEDHPLPLHGPNLWPSELGADFKETVLEYMEEMKKIGFLLMRAVALSLNIDPSLFGSAFADPTVLFRIFNYPPHDSKFGERSQAVGEHTDYGYLTVLKQDPSGGLQVRGRDGAWIEAPYIENTFVINLGDALEHSTGGLIRATPHRVLQRTGAIADRLSFPFFFDPNFRAPMTSIADLLTADQKAIAEANRLLAVERWDKADPAAYSGTYGRYLLTKVSKVFPGLASENISEIISSL